MKSFIALLLIIIVIYGGYTIFIKKNPIGPNSTVESSFSELAKSKNASLDKYESIIKSYEDKGGLKTQSDMLQFNSEMQSWSTSWGGDMTGISQGEMDFLQKRLKSLTSRQMKLMGR